ncbi:MAG: hypothetical protein UW16_C0026G0005 [Microgenomates group bacterium GW2011_GWC1_44_10]|nr:MAG: hypothetical protein UW16_C0026G0005 [Microgenomates group bacterium GW2011_GWC1_44_10]
MEPKVKQQAGDLFILAKKANLLSSEEFSEVFPKSTLSKISGNIIEDEKVFLQNSRTVKNPEKIWTEGIQFRITADVSQIFIDYLQEKGRAFTLDYDSPVEDVVFNFKSTSSDLDISDTGEEKIDGDSYQGMKIGEDVFKYKMTNQYIPGDVLFDIGRKLFPLSRALLCTNFGDQDQYLIVDLELAPEFTDFGFLSL